MTDSSGTKILLTFKMAAKEVGKKKGWHHHNGLIVPDNDIDYGYETYLYDTLKKDDAYKGEWFMPPRDLLHGLDCNGNMVRPENILYALKDTGAFAGTFTTVSALTDSGPAHWYWSCTEPRYYPETALIVRFTDGGDSWDRKDNARLSCRPCRVELVI